MDCDVRVKLGQAQKYGAQFKCCDCHSSYRFCRDKVPGWAKLGKDQKKEYILKNKDSGGRGKKRKLIAITSAGASALNLNLQQRIYIGVMSHRSIVSYSDSCLVHWLVGWLL